MNACASTPKPIIDNPARPEISQKYADLLRQASATLLKAAARPGISQAEADWLRQLSEALLKEVSKHEWAWQGYADKMEDRTK